MNKVILGGGIGGLSAAYYLRKKCLKDTITLIESTSRTGGWIKTSNQIDGHYFEQGPRTIRPQGPKGVNTLELIEELGLESQIIPISMNHPAAKNRMIYVNGALHTLPSDVLGIFKTQSPFSKPLIRYILSDLKAARKVIPENDESIHSFVERRFGREIADYAISPLICGICAGDAKQISVKFLMENLFTNEQLHGSVIKGAIYDILFKKKDKEVKIPCNMVKRAKEERWSVYTFADGLEILPKALQQKSQDQGVEILFDKSCKSVEIKDGVINLSFIGGDKITADHLISSLPSNTLGDLLVGHQPLSELLRSIPYVDVCVVNLHYKTKLLSKAGFGLLVPPSENLSILGVIFDSCILNHDSTVLTVMMGGHWFHSQFGKNPAEEYMLENALTNLKKVLGIQEKPDSYKVNILQNCIPQYVVGHHETINKIDNYIKEHNLPLSLCGSYYSGVGINDVIVSARNAVENLKI